MLRDDKSKSLMKILNLLFNWCYYLFLLVSSRFCSFLLSFCTFLLVSASFCSFLLVFTVRTDPNLYYVIIRGLFFAISYNHYCNFELKAYCRLPFSKLHSVSKSSHLCKYIMCRVPVKRLKFRQNMRLLRLYFFKKCCKI